MNKKKLFLVFILLLLLSSGCSQKDLNVDKFYEDGIISIYVSLDPFKTIDYEYFKNEYKDKNMTKEQKTYYNNVIEFCENYNLMITSTNNEDCEKYFAIIDKLNVDIFDEYYKNKEE